MARGELKSVVWLDDFAFIPKNIGLSIRHLGNSLETSLIPDIEDFYYVPEVRRATFTENFYSEATNLKLLERNNKIRIKRFVKEAYDRTRINN